MKIREIDPVLVERTVSDLCADANFRLRPDVLDALRRAREREKDAASIDMLNVLIENARIAAEKTIPLCQDTGMVVVYADLGQNARVAGDGLMSAIDRGVEKAYREKNLRKSVVRDPLARDNTGTNTPSIVHVDLTGGDRLRIEVMPKGFGSENKSVVRMLEPTSTEHDIIDLCVDAVRRAGPDGCPPYILGVGIGGTMDSCAMMAKKALLKPISTSEGTFGNTGQDLEHRIERAVNDLGIGVMGLGGRSTVIGVNIRKAPTHIAGLPVAVNVSCHALRSASAEL
ncbi:MAG: fumarate hydratase [Candidatus Omnitrophica bacterium]|nr:fumarate hydratase [Candidatus Omnitrophota bacterium]